MSEQNILPRVSALDIMMMSIYKAEKALETVRRMILTDGRPTDLNLKAFETHVNVCYSEIQWLAAWCGEECIK